MSNMKFDKPPESTRIVVAMSGGVDSSTAAALMVEQGYEVIGITLQLYNHGQAVGRANSCCAGQDIHDARRVADKLGIPHYVLDYESRFKEQVIEDFAASYLAGETPIPCIRCNQTVKFRDLVGMARDLGAAALITGHYVRRVEGEAGPELHRARDAAKDQSYFLFATTPEQLDYLRFPLGGMTKAETRRHAKRFGLAVAEKPDSQDICFVPDGSYAGIVEKLHPGAAEPGDVPCPLVEQVRIEIVSAQLRNARLPAPALGGGQRAFGFRHGDLLPDLHPGHQTALALDRMEHEIRHRQRPQCGADDVTTATADFPDQPHG